MTMKKGFYLLWPDNKYVDACIKSGINQILIANQNDSEKADEIHPHWGEYKESIKWIKALEYFYANQPDLDFVFLPIWNAFYTDLPKNQQFFDGERYYTRTPCPSSIEWIESRIDHAKFMVNQGKRISKVLWDAEHYEYRDEDVIKSINEQRAREDKPPIKNQVLEIWNDDKQPKHKCYCDRCKQLGFDKKELWKYHNELVLKYLWGLGHGQLGVSSAWNFHKYYDKWLYTEKTYPIRNVTKDKFKLFTKYSFDRVLVKARARKEGIKLKVSAGIWVERFTAHSLLNYIEFLGKNPVYDAYWLYSHLRMSRSSEIKHYSKAERKRYGELFESLIDDPDLIESDENFFIKLKSVNERIDKYRDSWKFKIKRKITDVFISALSRFM